MRPGRPKKRPASVPIAAPAAARRVAPRRCMPSAIIATSTKYVATVTNPSTTMVNTPTREKPSDQAASSSPAKIRTVPGSAGMTTPTSPTTTRRTARTSTGLSVDERHADDDACTVSFRTVDLHVAADQQGALAHAEQPKGSRTSRLLRRDAAAVVADFENEDAWLLPDVYADCGRLRVAQHVGQYLLADAEHGVHPLGIEVRRLERGRELRPDAGALLKLLHVPLDGRDATHVVEKGRPQISRTPTERIDGGLNER